LQLWESLICASALAKMGKNMQAITIKSIETETHPQTKMMFWFLFASTRGANSRIKIVKLLKNNHTMHISSPRRFLWITKL